MKVTKDMIHPKLRMMARIGRFVGYSGCVVAAPEYRTSLDAPYPAALEDCYAALLWLKEHGSEYGMRDNQVMVGGDSAGGGLTAAITLYARDKGEVAIAFQMPLYPMIDDRMNTESATDNDAPLWDSRANDVAWRLYLGELFGKDTVPAYAAPARNTDFNGLPPALSFVGSVEPFRDEAIEYMKRLEAQGIPVGFKVFEGAFHAFDILAPGSSVGKEATAFLMEGFDYAAKHCFAEQPSNPERNSQSC
ncbi:alpha/beta hydrolase [Oscillospiraceae bacterium OttesenSCG-928-F05]|nr:alpha/beta hydrolase [Oscillospiraceae bacterium OttesenSCG-928-F05]